MAALTTPKQPFFSGPFSLFAQRRWKKPASTAQTRLEGRTRDLRLDKLTRRRRRLELVLRLAELMAARRGSYVSVQIMSRWRGFVGMNARMGEFLHRHPVRKNLCCRVSGKMRDLVEEEAGAVRDGEEVAVWRLTKLLLMAPAGCLHTHALWLIRRELGLPDDFRVSILAKYNRDFRLVDPGKVVLVGRDEGLAVAEVERWREREYREKWLSEFETKYAFNMNFPTGFRIEVGFRERLKNWQRLPYLKPYEVGYGNGVSRQACGGADRFEKRAVGIIHELLSLTLEKMVEVERLSHFRRDFGMVVNIRELLQKHPGIFYISTKGNKQTVYLREAYSKGCLVEPNPVYMVRMKLLELICLGCRHTRELKRQQYVEEEKCGEVESVHCDLVCPVLESLDDENVSCNSHINITSNEDTNNEHEETWYDFHLALIYQSISRNSLALSPC